MFIQPHVQARCWIWCPLATGRGSLVFLDGFQLELEIIARGRALWRLSGTGKRLAWVRAAEA